MRSIVVPVVILGVVGAALAQEAAAPKPQAASAASPRIAVIDMSRVSGETLLGKGFAAQLEQLKNEIDSAGTKKQNDLNKMDADVKVLQDELEKQASVLSPDATEKKSQEIKKKQRDRQAFLEDGQAELERMREKARQQAQAYNNEFQARIRPHIDAVAKEKAIDILLDSQVAIVVNKIFDISQDVIVRADDAERAAGKQAGAAKPPAKPTPAPTPKP